MSLEIVEHKGVRVIAADFRSLSPAAMLQQLDDLAALAQELEEPVPFFADLTGCTVSREFLEKAKKIGALVGEKTTRRAIVGINSMKALLLKSFTAFTRVGIKTFSSDKEALSWLADGSAKAA